METFLTQLRRVGWAVVEAAFLLVVFCVLLNIILGGEADSFVSSVAGNAMNFLERLPAGVFLGIALIVMVYGLVKSRLQR
jgi:hypothetical protein